jgi:hypothetical protein
MEWPNAIFSGWRRNGSISFLPVTNTTTTTAKPNSTKIIIIKSKLLSENKGLATDFTF